jgi:pyrroline-5-carboxylate reductase
LLRPFTQEYGVIAEFNNEKVVFESDIIFVCCLPGQAGEIFKEVKYAMSTRIHQAKKDNRLSLPLVVSCLAATGLPKLKLMLMPETCFIRTRLNVALMRRYLQATGNEVPKYAAHPTK